MVELGKKCAKNQ